MVTGLSGEENPRERGSGLASVLFAAVEAAIAAPEEPPCVRAKKGVLCDRTDKTAASEDPRAAISGVMAGDPA